VKLKLHNANVFAMVFFIVVQMFVGGGGDQGIRRSGLGATSAYGTRTR
jgi:hypothetical protein